MVSACGVRLFFVPPRFLAGILRVHGDDVLLELCCFNAALRPQRKWDGTRYPKKN